MAQLALYRKYRSQTFEDLIGQEHIVRTLQSALSTGRTAQTYLFTGPRGTGKTSSARLLAKALNCEKGPTGTPCNECDQCRMITEGSHPDVIEMDAASDSGVDDVREKIVDVVSYAPMMGRYKVFIIDEVHDLSAKAFDALLKTVEEPPAHLVFILATTDFNKVPPTIRSRCQKYEFHRATLKNLMDRLAHVVELEGMTAEPAAISAIARMADGGYRDALTLLEQAILVSDGPITVDVVYDQLGLVSEEAVDGLLLALHGGDVKTVILSLETITRSGRDPRALLESMLHRLADLTRAIYSIPSDQIDASRESSMHEIAARLGRPFLVHVRSSLAEAHKVIRDISLPRLWLESEFVRIATMKDAPAVSPPQVRVLRTEAPVTTAPVAPAVVAPAIPKSVEVPAIAVVETVAAPITAATVQVDTQSSAPLLDPADAWTQLLKLIPDNKPDGGVLPHKMKLKGAHLIEDSGEELRVGFSRQMDLDWFTDNPARFGYIKGFLEKIERPNTKLIFELEKKNHPRVIESEAVELPVDGARLVGLVKEVFQVPDGREED